VAEHFIMHWLEV